MSMNTKKNFNGSRSGFTLIELLIVISIIAVLAAFTIAVMGGVKKTQYISHTRAELEVVATAIDDYKADHGYYPPGNGDARNSVTNQLYYELGGAVFGNGTYTNLDGDATITPARLTSYFGVNGIMNCTQGSGDEAKKAKNYLTNLKPGQIASDANGVKVLVGTIEIETNQAMPLFPMPTFTSGIGNHANPFRYVYPGTNNPSSYDLWIQLPIGSKEYLICNWTKQVPINSPLP